MSDTNVLSSWIRRKNGKDKNDKEEDKEQNVNLTESEKILQKMTSYQQIQLDVLHKAKFTTTFTGDPKDTIPYLFAVDMFFKVHMINNPNVRFSTIFQTLPIKYREEFMIEHADKDDYTIYDLFDWIITTFPPPRSKFEFELALKSVVMRKAENPLTVYNRLLTKYKNITKAINLINMSITDEKQKLLPFTDEFQANILAGIFIRKNNNEKYHNVHELNKEVRKHCLRWSSHTMDDWKEIIKKFNTIVKDVLSGDKKYQYKLYPPSAAENKIYYFNNNTNKPKDAVAKQLHITKRKYPIRKRKHYDRSYYPRNNNKRQKVSCLRCGKNGHVKTYCHSTYHINGQRLQRNRTVTCNRCFRSGHRQNACFATKDKDGKLISGKPPASSPAHYKSSNNNRKQFNTFKQYNPSKNPENIRQRKELKAEQERRNKKYNVFNIETEDLNKLPTDQKEYVEKVNVYLTELCEQHGIRLKNNYSPRRRQ